MLDQFVRTQTLGEVVGAETGFILCRNPDTVRAPDAAFVAVARLPAEGLPEGYFPGAPDLAVEVVSPDDRAAEMARKVDEYFAAGARLVWVIYPDPRAVHVFGSARASVVLTAGDRLDGADVIPGFGCAVDDLF